jgi:two-component system, cell cycle sensor histidine kinase and response regulator CckA
MAQYYRLRAAHRHQSRSAGTIVLANTHFLQLVGWEEHEVVGRDWFDLFIPAHLREQVRTVFFTVMQQKDILDFSNYENEIMTRTGELRNIAWSNVLSKDIDGNIIDATCLGVDLTERKRAMAALRESEERHRTIIMTAMDGFWIVDEHGCILETNDTYCRMSGYTEQELLSMHISDLEAQETADETARHMRCLISMQEDRFFTRHRRKDGTLLDVEIRAQYNRALEGLFVVFLRDITEQKRSEEKLKESEARFKALHNASFGGIAIHDKGRILECNQGLAEITGFSVAELIGMDGLLLIAPGARDLVKSNIQTGYEHRYEAMGIRKNGEEYPLRLEARNIPYKGRQVRVVEFRDITAIKENEAERERLQMQLLQAQKMESVGRLAGGIAHDFNNMLGVILGRTEMAMESVDPSLPLRADLEHINEAAVRSVNLTRQLLAFARKQTIAPKVLDFNEVVSSMLYMVQRLIGEDIDLVWLPKANLWQVKMDPSQLDQILANLCVNARDAIAGVGKITIETDNTTFDAQYCATHQGYIPGDYVQLALSDNGCGMALETINHIFEPFFTTKETGKGTGLGLATVFGIVKQNNGFINVYSEPGRGTTFKIYLPRYSAANASAAKNAARQSDKRGDETILLVEDEAAILAMTTAMLERLGYTVLPANTPAEALALAASYNGRISLLLTDVVMPGMNGRDLALQIKTLQPTVDTLFMSGYTANVIAHHGVLDTGVQFLEKPFSRNDLATKIREVLSRNAD